MVLAIISDGKKQEWEKEDEKWKIVRSIWYGNRGQERLSRAGDETAMFDLGDQREKIMSLGNLSGLQTSIVYCLEASVSIFEKVSLSKCITFTLYFILIIKLKIPGINNLYFLTNV